MPTGKFKGPLIISLSRIKFCLSVHKRMAPKFWVWATLILGTILSLLFGNVTIVTRVSPSGEKSTEYTWNWTKLNVSSQLPRLWCFNIVMKIWLKQLLTIFTFRVVKERNYIMQRKKERQRFKHGRQITVSVPKPKWG